LLSISQDPSSTSKINKFLCTVLFQKKNNEGERRERLPAQRGEIGNSTRVLSRLAGSGEMLVFLRDFIKVLSRLAGTKQHQRRKIYFENLKLVSQITLPNLKHCDLAEFCVFFN